MYKLRSQIHKVLLSVLFCSIVIIGETFPLPVSYAESEPIKIMPIGDSLTAGIGDPDLGAYRTDLYNYYKNAGISFDFVGSQSGGPSSLPDKDNEGHSGWTIPQISSNINGWLNTYNPDAVLLWIGGNDMIAGNINTSGLSSLIDQITSLKPNIKLFVADYYALPASDIATSRVMQYDAAIPEIVRSKFNAGKNVYFVKLSDANLAASDYYTDNLHLTPSGYSKIANIWYKGTISVLQSMANSRILYGDLNGDGKIDSTDLSLMKKYILKNITEFSVSSKTADLDGSGSINTYDYALLKRYLLQLITTFPVNAK